MSLLEQYALYLVLKDIINKLGYGFEISFNDYDINGDNIVGITCKDGNTPKYRELSTGKYYGCTNRVQFIIQSGITKSSLINTLNLISNIKEILTSNIINNKYIVSSLRYIDGKIIENTNDKSGEDVYVWVTKIHLIGGGNDFKGKTSQTRSIYAINTMFEYYVQIGGN